MHLLTSGERTVREDGHELTICDTLGSQMSRLHTS